MLTPKEENLIKDVLKIIGRDPEMEHQFANGIGMEELEFSDTCDEIFKKLGNGRVTFDTGGENKLI